MIEEGLRDAALSDLTIFVDRRSSIAARLETLSSGVVLINLANPHRDELFALSKAMARPVAMFVDQSDVAGIDMPYFKFQHREAANFPRVSGGRNAPRLRRRKQDARHPLLRKQCKQARLTF